MAQKFVGALDEKRRASILEDYESDPKNVLLRHALVRSTVTDVVFNNESLQYVAPLFSLNLDTMPVANQKNSGRCWIFAALNFLRELIAKKAGIKPFELSQNYISLYDKIEKSNFLLEALLTMVDKPTDDRTLQFLLRDPVSDGGQWDMFVNLVKKYGLVPQKVFPETFNSNYTRSTDELVNAAIRSFAAKAHHLSEQKASPSKIRALKEKTMDQIYSMFLNAFGIPPKKFDFEYEDKKGAYGVVRDLTPLDFFNKYIGSEIDDYQSIINSPTDDKPYFKNYTIDYLGNVVEGRPINHLNLPMKRIKELIIAQLRDGTPVWFGSDVSFYRDRSASAWDDKALDFKDAFGFTVDFDKTDMLDFYHSAMNHAMLITGVNLVKSKPTKWKIENSWGTDNGYNGYYVMSASWFDTFVYQVVINKKYLTDEEKKAALAEPKHLPPWDPFGSLAD